MSALTVTEKPIGNFKINLSGKRYGLLTVLPKSGTDQNKRTFWRCRCDCGNEKWIAYSTLTSSHDSSCGCQRTRSRRKSITGMHFGKLSVLEIAKRLKESRYHCLCECGNVIVARRKDLLRGDYQSCGCERNQNIGKAQAGRFDHYRGIASANNVFRAYAKSAKRRGLTFEINQELFFQEVVKPCIYCGASLTNSCSNAFGNGDFAYTGLDRINPEIGYLPSNVVPCCVVCNKAKLRMGVDQFRQWIVTVYNHWAKHLG